MSRNRKKRNTMAALTQKATGPAQRVLQKELRIDLAFVTKAMQLFTHTAKRFQDTHDLQFVTMQAQEIKQVLFNAHMCGGGLQQYMQMGRGHVFMKREFFQRLGDFLRKLDTNTELTREERAELTMLLSHVGDIEVPHDSDGESEVGAESVQKMPQA